MGRQIDAYPMKALTDGFIGEHIRLGPGAVDDVGEGDHDDFDSALLLVRQSPLLFRPRYVLRMDTPGERLKAARVAAGYDSAAKAARAFGWHPQNLADHEANRRGIKPDQAKQYAKALKTTPEDILYGAGADPAEPQLALLPITRTAQAGAWLAVDEFDQREPELSTAARDPRFPNAHQWLTRVRGDSVNLLGINDGDLVHCIDVDEAHYQVNTGDIVEVERSRYQGADLEYSIKQAEVTPEAILLWPRSTNPRWTKPLEISAGKESEDLTVTIRGLVIAAIKRF